jgi:hypothetical protein
MKKEKVFIVVSHKNVLKYPVRRGSKTEWEIAEKVEFVNQLRNKHITSSSAIGDYINRKMETGARFGMGDYETFETYIRSKYAKEMAELDKAYRNMQATALEATTSPEVFADKFGNVRARTVFDPA